MRIFCWLGWHKWEFKEVTKREWEASWGWIPATYFGTCKRCGTTNIFYGN